jgi:flagellar biosynthesis protein FliR
MDETSIQTILAILALLVILANSLWDRTVALLGRSVTMMEVRSPCLNTNHTFETIT